MTQASSSDHHRFRPGIEDGYCFLDSMVGGDPSIRQGGNIFGGQAGIQLNDGAIGRLQKRGHATINRETWKGWGDAVHIIPRTASAAEAAGDLRVDDDSIPNRHVANSRSNLLNPARILMA